MRPYAYAAQYQQRPAPAGGGVVRWEWFRTFDPANPPNFTRIVQSWDTATKDNNQSDYSVCVTIGETSNRHLYVIDLYRGRLLFPELKRKLMELAKLHKASTVLIEDSSSGTQLIQLLRHEGYTHVQAIKPKASKFERLNMSTDMIEGGIVWLPNQAHWLDPLESELCLFPNAKHDDQVDALSQGLIWMGDSSGPAYFLWALDEVDRRRREGS